MKPIRFDKLQRGLQPDDFKPMWTIGKGVEEIRIWDLVGHVPGDLHGAFKGEVVVLHAFQKKIETTSAKDVALA